METKAAIVKPEKQEEKNLVQKISEFISKKRIIFISATAGIVAVLAIAAAYTLISNSMANASARAMEEARAKIATWNQESDEAKKAEVEKDLLASLENVTKKWPKTFAAQQASYTMAGFYSSKKDWENAEKYALAASSKNAQSYLAPLALELAAVAAEEAGKADAAFDHYSSIVKKYTVDTPNLAHAYFSLGRLSEAKEDWKSALENYEKLSSGFSESDWAKLAKDRAIYLRSKGYDK